MILAGRKINDDMSKHISKEFLKLMKKELKLKDQKF